MKILFLCALNILWVTAAQGGCISMKDLDKESVDCNDNGNFVDAGIQCFLGFENLVKKQAGVTAKGMKRSNDKFVNGDRNSQTSGQEGMVSNMNLSVAALDAMIAAGKAARKDIDSYAKNIFFPEEWDAPEEMIGNGLDYLNSSACYAEPRDILNDMVQRTDQYIADLEMARQVATAMKKTSTGRDANLDQMNGMRLPAAATNGPGAKAVKKGKKPKNGKSTITGVEEDKKKRTEQ
ncbi:MAG TPA: hypothetical protein VIH99_03880 [Bdellovibrionota bacterium]